MTGMNAKIAWDTELYEANHSFVWQRGEALVDLLQPLTGERILDLGCGTGHLTAKLAESGADVLGIDSSPAMIGQARQNFPLLTFKLANASEMNYADEFDGIFSNAALHWMTDASTVAANMARALRPAGRLVFEMGGKGNIYTIEKTIVDTLQSRSSEPLVDRRNYFPSVAEYASVLEGYGFEIRLATLFDRPTPLSGEGGMEDWIRQFKWYYFDNLEPKERKVLLAEIIEKLRPLLYRDGEWTADYRRLRMIAVKKSADANW